MGVVIQKLGERRGEMVEMKPMDTSMLEDFQGFLGNIVPFEARTDERGVHRFEGIWLDIGRIDDYEAATGILEAHRSKFLPGDLA